MTAATAGRLTMACGVLMAVLLARTGHATTCSGVYFVRTPGDPWFCTGGTPPQDGYNWMNCDGGLLAHTCALDQPCDAGDPTCSADKCSGTCPLRPCDPASQLPTPPATTRPTCVVDQGTKCEKTIDKKCRVVDPANGYTDWVCEPDPGSDNADGGGCKDRNRWLPACGVGGPLAAHDPVNANSGASFKQVTEVRISDSVGGFQLTRSHVSAPETWTDRGMLGTTGESFIPSPYGSFPWVQKSVEWWHSLYSFVFPTGWIEGEHAWYVRQADGVLLKFTACGPTYPCWASRPADSRESGSRLRFTGTTFELYVRGGARFVYGAKWLPVSGQVQPRYFLSQILDDSGRGQTLSVSYQLPPDAGSGAACPGGVLPDGGVQHVPYISSVTTGDGVVLNFQHRGLPSQVSEVARECVLSSVTVVDRNDAGTTTEVPLVVYTYAGNLDGGPEAAGRLATAYWPQQGTWEAYVYQQGASRAFQVWPDDAGSSSAHSFDGGGRVLVVKDFEGEHAAGGVTGQSCPSNTCCLPGSALSVTFTTANTSSGNGTSTVSKAVQYDSLQTDFAMEAKAYSLVESCTGSDCGGTQSRTTSFNWTCSASGIDAVPSSKQDARGNYTVSIYDAGPVISGGPFTPSELVERKWGATSSSGTGAVESETYTYVYTDSTIDGGASAKEQRLASRTQASVLSGPSAVAQEVNDWDTATGRLKSQIRTGNTSVFTAGTNTWSTPQQWQATFYKTSRSCGDTSTDPKGRVVEVHGPCWVGSLSATSCPTGATIVPVTQFEYWGSGAGALDANRLKRVTKFPNLTNPASCAFDGTELTTTFENYDARGHALNITDPNGVVTRFEYRGEHPVKRTVTATSYSRVTEWGWDNDRLAWVKYPEGNYEVYSWRDGSNVWKGRLQWRAKSSTSTASTYSEKVAYEYWSDGSLKKETYLSSSAATRRIVNHAADAHGRPAWQGWGDSPASTGYTAVRAFDRADNLAGIGVAGSGATAWCGGISADTPSDKKCAWLAYDTGNRLSTLSEWPTSSSSNAVTTCFDYDAHGNISKVTAGCAAGSVCSDSACANMASLYQHDDFGNLVLAELPNSETSSARGQWRSEFDAQGNAIRRQTPRQKSTAYWTEHDFDGLGRLKQTREVSLAGPLTTSTLTWDTGASGSGCGEAASLYAKGRLRFRDDTFGRTAYGYDPEGRVLRETRRRGTGGTTCSATLNESPHTVYTYTNNGNLASIAYPHGTPVTYSYGSGALVDRVASVSAGLKISGSTQTKQLISAVEWEPYGAIAAYKVSGYAGSQVDGTVEYLLGDNGGTTPTLGCTNSRPSTPGDSTGRLRAIWVTASDGGTIGGGAGEMIRKTYTWQGDVLKYEDTCQRGTALRHAFDYDNQLRLVGAVRDGGTGGPLASHTWQYDARGNRTQDNPNGLGGTALTFSSTAWKKDTLTDVTYVPTDVWYAPIYENMSSDSNGRLDTRLYYGADSSGDVAWRYDYSYYTDAAGGAGNDVFRQSRANNAGRFDYYYDAFNRRRFKAYPVSGVDDEYFYDLGHQLLEDRGSKDFTTASPYPIDEYVWLDGRPVAVIHGSFNASWVRNDDLTGTCTRANEAQACGVYFPVTDYLGKQIAVLDSSLRIAATADYDPFGRVNHVETWQYQAPAQSPGDTNVQTWTQPIPTGMSVDVRPNFYNLDLEDCVGGKADTRDYFHLSASCNTTSLSERWTGYHRGHFYGGWTAMPSGGSVPLCYHSDEYDVDPGASCSGKSSTTWNYWGMAIRGYEYRRKDSTATWFLPPLRFPGQYADEETETFENWNRYYDPSLGRYLQAEPLMATPGFLAMEAAGGSVSGAYSYAGNSPLFAIDPTGRFRITEYGRSECPNFDRAVERVRAMAGCDDNGNASQSCECQNKIRYCTDGKCDICTILQPGHGPMAFPDVQWSKSGATSYTQKLSRMMLGLPGPLVTILEVHLNSDQCKNPTAVSGLADALLEEAFHVCEFKAYGDMSHGGTLASGKLDCDAFDVSQACGSRP